tara:strand:+ start:220 stop:1101 length:882 start_codon:yes stop_codon:yes gene_type:complete
MSFPIINWQSSNEVLVREFTKGFTETGFIRIYNLWNEDESEIIEEWYSTVKSWFLTANNKSKYRADQNLQNGWHDIDETYLNPRTNNDFKQCFEIDQFDNFEGLPPTLRNSIIKTFPLIHKRSMQIIALFELMLGTEQGYLTNLHDDKNLNHLRTAYYPGSNELENQLPCGEHKDYNSITLLFSPDKNKKLQIKTREGTWKDIPYLDNSVVINIGNLMQVWSQDYLYSAFHRVLFNENDSFTTAYFLNLPNNLILDKIGPNSKKYKDVSVEKFSKQFQKTKEIIRMKDSLHVK